MKSAFAFASAAAVGQAVNVQEGYVIDLCPTEAMVSPIVMAGSDQLLGMSQAEGFVVAPTSTSSYGIGAARWNNLNKMESMYKQGLAAAAYEELANRFEEEECLLEPGMLAEETILLERLGAIRAAASSQNWNRGYGSLAVGQVITPASYNTAVGVIERESFLPGMIERQIATIPGAFRDDSFVELGYSYSPDSYTPGSYQFDANCAGQAVTVYPEREPTVLWCGERDLQGNQTLKRTNIHHNYVHDINQYHNYHNRTRHQARQYNTMEKDCSCKGVGVEASYQCPPGIEAPAARAVAASFINTGVGSFKETCPLGLTKPKAKAPCPCSGPK